MICVYQCQEKQRLDLLLAMVPRSALCGSSASPTTACLGSARSWSPVGSCCGRERQDAAGGEPGGPGLLCLPQDAFILQLFREDILCRGAVAHVWHAVSFLFLPCSVQSTRWLRCRVSKLRPFPEGNDSTHTPQAVKVISKEQLRADQTAFGMKIGL